MYLVALIISSCYDNLDSDKEGREAAISKANEILSNTDPSEEDRD
jgi:hypothetical protein